ncbi:protocadherin-23-like [Chanos chanos]|uniref:Protocadherin-23-like n=1 Tax=Chanos chanos TaxID=29144 RepID=A0A6J2UMU6_CHACN|nr:protocadherin-23-like [Chanos chanos]
MKDAEQRRMSSWSVLRFFFLLYCAEQISAQIRYSVPEEVNEGSIVGNIAKDLGLDVRTLVERRFRIVSGSKDALFQVNEKNGVMYVLKKIDREELCDSKITCYVNLKIAVENPLEIHHISVEITDINDNTPSFSENEQHFDIAEHTRTGTRFQLHRARDPDITQNSVHLYKLSQSDYFDIDTRNGDEEKIPFLVLKKPLDRENIAEHQLVLTAVDGGNQPRSGTLNVTVTVLDINDNPPVFSQDKYSVVIHENATVGSIVTKINATDIDEGSNSEIEYALGKTLKRKVYDTFQLDHVTGELKIKGELDFEDTEVYKLDVLATDKGQPPLTTESRVIIRILDVNDNKPELEVTSLSNVVSEDSKPGTVISLVSISDKDSGVNGKVLCSLSDSLPFQLKQSFQDNMYSLVTKGSLDRELISNYDITITATDMGQPPLSTFKTLNVQVSDVNDNSPQFSQNPVEFYLVENNAPGALIFSVSASDKDINENAMISYRIVRGNGSQNDMTSFLNINSENGNIHALKSFDFEKVKAFQFHVVATDSGVPSLSSNVTVKVFILDENDNMPVILSPVSTNGSAETVEEIPRNVNAGHLVTKIRAYDADIGYNGWLLFSLQEITDHSLFGLDRYTGQIRTLRSFTETDEADHKLVIVVKDNGNVSLSATATVIIKAVEPKEAFAASDDKGAVKEDEENSATFYLIITLCSVSVLFLITVIVLIVMQCSKPTDYTSKYLQDTTYDGTLCHSIQYRSGDKRYMLVGPRISMGSTISPGSNGNTLTADSRHESTLGVRVILHSLLALFFYEEAFSQIRYSVAEESKQGAVVGNIAKDLGFDVAKLIERRFRIVSGANDSLLQINQENGALLVGGNIDREQLCGKISLCSLNLKIAAENPLVIHYIEVEITDINDHSPQFPENVKHLEVSENAVPHGTRFPLDPARDPDVGINSLRKYILSPNDHFELDVKTRGEEKIPFLILKRALDREQKSQLALILTAYDGGIPEKSGILNVTVKVIDINDNAPVFDRQVYTVILDENSPLGTSVVRLHATDLDEGANGQIVYTFDKTLKNKAFELFEIEASTGEIFVKGLIDFEEQSVYEIDVQATDKGPVALTGQCSVIIDVRDINDNAPEIEVTALSSHLPENASQGAAVALISISDKDSGENGVVICSLPEESPFELKPSFQSNVYSLVTKARLDRESTPMHFVTITATDKGDPSLCAYKTIKVDISDVNDNRPIFSENPYTFYMSENNTPGASIFSLSASDMDQNENAQISYHIEKGESTEQNVVSYLNINSEDGTVYALKRFDFERTKKFQFQVIARDSGSPPLSTNVSVNVFILDENDNAPVILSPLNVNGSAEGVEEIPRNVNAGHLVAKVRAYDADIGYNGWLLFFLLEVTDHSLFGLDRYTGQIRTLRPFTETDEAEHKLIIVVKDNGNVSLSATVTVIIKIVEPKEAFAASDIKSTVIEDEENNMTFYLIITLCSVSVLFLISIIVLIVMQCSKSTDYSSKYLQDTSYDGTLCHSIQYRSGDKRYMLVGPRMSVGSTIVPGSNGNTLLVPDRRTRVSGEVRTRDSSS